MKKIYPFIFLLVLVSLTWAQDPGNPDSMWVEIDNPTVPAEGGDVVFRIKFYTDNSGAGNDITGFAIPLYITNSNPSADPVLDNSVANTFSNTAVSGFTFLTASVTTNDGDSSFFPLQYLLGAIALGAGATSGNYTFANVKIHISDTTTLCIDSLTSGEQSLNFVTSTPAEYIPNWNALCRAVGLQQNPNELKITAESPVNLVVIDPKQDSIGIDFNTILEGSSYDTTQDVNSDGEKDDVIKIPLPYVGDYQIRVIPVDTGHFSLGIRIDGNDQVILANNVVIADTDTTFGYQAEVLPSVRGDVNKDNKKNLTDIIYLVNYVFKGGPAPDPAELGNVNCSSGAPNLSDIVYMVNYVFKAAKAPCS